MFFERCIFRVLSVFLFLLVETGIASQSTVQTTAKDKAPQIPMQKFEKDLVESQEYINANKIKVLELHNLNPHINRWFLLTLGDSVRAEMKWLKGLKKQKNDGLAFRLPKDKSRIFHLENRDPKQTVRLKKWGLLIGHKDHRNKFKKCHLWSDGFDLRMLDFEKMTNPYFPICNGLLYIRLKKSSRTQLSATEWSTEILRKSEFGDFGEGIINTFKPFLVGLNAEGINEIKSDLSKVISFDKAFNPAPKSNTPLTPSRDRIIIVDDHNLGIKLKKQAASDQQITLGEWYSSSMHKGVFTSLFTPESVSQEVLASYKKRVYPINESERDKLVYITAYDLDKYTIHYAVGTEHPPINTSIKAYGRAARWKSEINGVGNIPPYDLTDSIGVFIGGFKRRHSVFKAGPHKGKYYGYIQNGVELEPMSDGLATLLADTEGRVDIREWPSKPASKIEMRQNTVSARQNGTLILQNGIPTEFVKQWKAGNWSADAKGVRTSLRAGVCMQTGGDKKYLLFMAFTAATPSAMARVMQAYQCQNAMHLDMNAYVYIHNALFNFTSDKKLEVEYLNTEMHYPKGTKRHRFILDNNNRDFFYIKKVKKNRESVVSSKESRQKDEVN